MPISHLCLTCGLDLARVRPRLDPALRLPIVLCPECGSACVRRRHPLVRTWRRSMRARRAGWLLIGQIATAATLLLIVGGVSRSMADHAEEEGVSVWVWIVSAFRLDTGPAFTSRAENPFVVAVWLAGAIIAGVWLGAALPHWKRWAPAFLWVALLPAAVAIDAGTWLVWAPVAAAAGRHDPYWGPTLPAWWDATSVALAAGVLTVAVSPVGWFVRELASWLGRRRWRARRARLQLERGGL